VRRLMRASVWPVIFMAMSAAQAYEPKVNYMLNCMGCHTENGAGAPGKVPSIRNTLVPFAQLAAGRRFLVQVPGTAQSPLSNREVAELLNWMLRNLSAQARPPGLADFTAAEVTSYRRQRLVDVAGTRARLLAAAR
jgi:mono/diheme cytochrome c family protein